MVNLLANYMYPPDCKSQPVIFKSTNTDEQTEQELDTLDTDEVISL